MAAFLARIYALDAQSIALVVFLCGIGFVIMKETVNIPGLAIASFPLLVGSSLAAQIFLADVGFAGSLSRAAFLALATGTGMISALVVIIVLVRIGMLLTDKVAPRPETRH